MGWVVHANSRLRPPARRDRDAPQRLDNTEGGRPLIVDFRGSQESNDPQRHTARQFSVADSAALSFALLTPSLFLGNIKLRHPSPVLSPPFDRLGVDAESTAEGLTEAALGLFGSVVFFGVDPAEMPAAFCQFLE
jgi:hypothetical protein